MKCPLRVRSSVIDVGEVCREFLECIGGECAWYHKDWHQCGVIKVSFNLEELWKAFDNLAREINLAVLRK